MSSSDPTPPEPAPPHYALSRRLTLPLLVLYGLGVTIGAGIYVLIGLTAEEAGMYAPLSFLLAAAIVTFSGLSYAEFSTHYPVSAGEAVFVESGLGLPWLTLLVGLTIALAGLVSAATVSIGAAAYIEQLVPVPPALLIAVIVLGLGVLAAWGILESVAIAAAFTLIEIGGLVFVVAYAVTAHPDLLSRAGELVPPLELSVWTGIASGGLIAFFAFVGFEDLVNVAEEAKAPQKNMPRAILYTLAISTLLYLAVTSVIVLAVPLDALRQSTAPLTLVFGADADVARDGLALVAGIAALNGILIQMIMASRVLYGLADRGRLPPVLARVNPVTRTPLVATGFVVAATLVLSLLLPVQALAQTTSALVLSVFAIVNFALVQLKRKGDRPAPWVFSVPDWVPWVGLVSCLGLLSTSLL